MVVYSSDGGRGGGTKWGATKDGGVEKEGGMLQHIDMKSDARAHTRTALAPCVQTTATCVPSITASSPSSLSSSLSARAKIFQKKTKLKSRNKTRPRFIFLSPSQFRLNFVLMEIRLLAFLLFNRLLQNAAQMDS